MYKQKKEHSLIPQLCRHITELQEKNVELQGKVEMIERQQEVICEVLGFESWQEFMDDILHQKCKVTTAYQKTSSSSRYNSPPMTFTPSKSPIESPIHSESRVLNHSIRGDTQRSSSLHYPFPQTQNDADATILSIENTKLRQQISFLQEQLCEHLY